VLADDTRQLQVHREQARSYKDCVHLINRGCTRSAYPGLRTADQSRLHAFGAGACDPWVVLEIAQEQDQKIAACGSFYQVTPKPAV
jgi:hypothetical protein